MRPSRPARHLSAIMLLSLGVASCTSTVFIGEVRDDASFTAPDVPTPLDASLREDLGPPFDVARPDAFVPPPKDAAVAPDVPTPEDIPAPEDVAAPEDASLPDASTPDLPKPEDLPAPEDADLPDTPPPPDLPLPEDAAPDAPEDAAADITIPDSSLPDITTPDVAPDVACAGDARLGTTCSAGIGACRGNGRYECGPDGASAVCNAVAAAPTPERCDGVDNDCDGVIDNAVVRDCPAPASEVGYTRTVTTQPWVDACTASSHHTFLTGSDDGVDTETLPFAFRYYGVPFTTLGISSNGMVSFSAASSQYTNTSLPYASIPNTIFAFWDDIYQRSGICTTTIGAAPHRQFVIEWVDDYFYGSSPSSDEHLTFEVILSETSNNIDVLYNTLRGQGDRAVGSSATIGLQRETGYQLDQVGHDTAGIAVAGSGYHWEAFNTDPSGVGACVAGRQTCRMGEWEACIGRVSPSAERCNGADDDCNGTVDEACTP